MNKGLLLLITLLLLFSSCSVEDSGGSSEEPSVLTLERIQTIGDLSGGVFSAAPVTLIRKHRGYGSDGEPNVLGFINDVPGDVPDRGDRMEIVAYDGDTVTGLSDIRILFYYSGPGTYSSAADPADDNQISIKINTDYDTFLRGGYQAIAGRDVSITITSDTDGWIEGSFTGSMEYYDGATYNNEVTNTNQPVINGSFKVYRF